MASFENLPLISAIFPYHPKQNVNRINLIHYNVQRLASSTRDAVEAVHEQLSQTSLMTLQNRIALDLLQAEKERYALLCLGTAIADNTAPDGSLTKSLFNLRTLAIEIKIKK